MKSILSKINAFGIQPISVIQAPTAAAAIIFSSLSVFTLIWSFTAQIPKTVLGTAILLPSDGLLSIRSTGIGQVIFPFIRKNGKTYFSPPEWSGDAYRFLQKPSSFTDQQVIDLTSKVINDEWKRNTRRTDLSRYSGGKKSGGINTVNIKKQQFIAYIFAPAQRTELVSAFQSLKTSLNLAQRLQKSRDSSLAYETDATNMAFKMLDPLKDLVDKGYMSYSDYLSKQSEAADRKSQLVQSQSSADSIRSRVIENQGQLRSTLSKFLHDQFVFSPGDGEVVDFVAPQWSQIMTDQKLLTMKWEKQIDHFSIPIFINQVAASQINVGMETISTPLGFSSAEIGGIKGTISSFDPIPVSSEVISSSLSSKGIAALVAPLGSTYRATIKLKRDKEETLDDYRNKLITNNRGGYMWNNKANPPLAPRDGILLSTQITTRTQTPIQMLIPVLKEGLGIAPPYKLELLQQGQVPSEEKK